MISTLSVVSQHDSLKFTPCIFPGVCEESNLTTEEQISCTESKLIWFLQEVSDFPSPVKNPHCKAKIVVSFVINEKGRVEDKSIVKSACEELDLAILETLDMLPRFKPAKNNGVAQKTKYTLPIRIHLK